MVRVNKNLADQIAADAQRWYDADKAKRDRKQARDAERQNGDRSQRSFETIRAGDLPAGIVQRPSASTVARAVAAEAGSFDAKMRRLALRRKECAKCGALAGQRCWLMKWQPDPADPSFEIYAATRHYARGFHKGRPMAEPVCGPVAPPVVGAEVERARARERARREADAADRVAVRKMAAEARKRQRLLQRGEE